MANVQIRMNADTRRLAPVPSNICPHAGQEGAAAANDRGRDESRPKEAMGSLG